MAPGTSSMLRARRRDVNIKPNRLLDRNSSRGMIYENEELRLRTININAEVEKGHNDIKKLRRENDQLRREIWNLRDEYDRLESLFKTKQEGEDEEEEEEEEESDEGEEPQGSTEAQQEVPDGTEAGGPGSDGDVLSVVEEEPEDCLETIDSRDKPKTVSFREEPPHNSMRPESADTVVQPNLSNIPSPQNLMPRPLAPALIAKDFPGLHTNLQTLLSAQPTQKVFSPGGGSEVITTAILQRRQSFTQNGDQTKDTLTCATSRHTTSTPEDFSCSPFPATDPPEFRPPGNQCELYTGPVPSFIRINSVQPYTVVFSVTDPRLINLSVQEVIDEMSVQLSAALMHSLRGVRLVSGSCYLSFSAQQDADASRGLPLTLRGLPIHLEDAAAGTTVLLLTGVPHDATDDSVAEVLSSFGSLVGPVERRIYKGVDTGERVVRVRPRLAVPRWIWVDDCRVCLKVIRPEEITNFSLSRRKSFRSHISVNLMPVSEDSPAISPLPTSLPTGPLPIYTTCAVGQPMSSAAPSIGGSVPSIPVVVPNSTESQVSFLSGASTSTPNIFQETPFLFPKPKSAETSGLRRINSVLGTMSLGDSQDNAQARSASSPPTATLSVRNAVSDGDTPGNNTIPASPNTARKAMQRHKPSRKISKMSTDSRKVNGETSSSDQDSPQKPGRRRPSSVYFKRPGAGILNRTLSIDQTDGTGYDATCSERERSNSDLSSRLSICKRKLSTTGRESGKVPWCGCWGNGCI